MKKGRRGKRGGNGGGEEGRGKDEGVGEQAFS